MKVRAIQYNANGDPIYIVGKTTSEQIPTADPSVAQVGMDRVSENRVRRIIGQSEKEEVKIEDKP